MDLDLELDIDALQMLAGEETQLFFSPPGQCGISCSHSCKDTCGITG